MRFSRRNCATSWLSLCVVGRSIYREVHSSFTTWTSFRHRFIIWGRSWRAYSAFPRGVKYNIVFQLHHDVLLLHCCYRCVHYYLKSSRSVLKPRCAHESTGICQLIWRGTLIYIFLSFIFICEYSGLALKLELLSLCLGTNAQLHLASTITLRVE